jgi:hypothetical protein
VKNGGLNKKWADGGEFSCNEPILVFKKITATKNMKRTKVRIVEETGTLKNE